MERFPVYMQIYKFVADDGRVLARPRGGNVIGVEYCFEPIPALDREGAKGDADDAPVCVIAAEQEGSAYSLRDGLLYCESPGEPSGDQYTPGSAMIAASSGLHGLRLERLPAHAEGGDK
jgi:hypothetical protein